MTERLTYKPPAEIRHPKKRAFLAAFAQCGGVHRACSHTGKEGIHHKTFYDWRSKDPAFAAAFEEAREVYIEALEAEADRRAFEGCRKIKFNAKGLPFIDPETRKPYVEHEYSDTLLIFRLKALRPDVYRERQHVTISEERQKAEIHRAADRLLRLVTPNGNGSPEHDPAA